VAPQPAPRDKGRGYTDLPVRHTGRVPWALHRYDSDHPISLDPDGDVGQAASGDGDVDRLITSFHQRGIEILASAVTDGGRRLNLLVHHLGADATPPSAQPPFHHLDSLELQLTAVEDARRTSRPLAEPDETLLDPRPEPWTGVDIERAGGRELVVRFTHGVVDALHHVDVVETDEGITITLYLGTHPRYAEGEHWVILVAYRTGTVVRLRRPLGNRWLRDGAPQPAAGP